MLICWKKENKNLLTINNKDSMLHQKTVLPFLTHQELQDHQKVQ